MGLKLTVDELTARGIEKIQTPLELDGAFQTIIAATPKTVPQEKVLEIFGCAWVYVRGGNR